MQRNASNHEVAAGGLVQWHKDGQDLIAIVHRAKYKDWVLPKGRPNPGETLEGTALREAMEETKVNVVIGMPAGSYSYEKEGRPKTVFIWHMTRGTGEYAKPAPTDEIDEVQWLRPKEALKKLDHQSEKDLVARHCFDFAPTKQPSCRWNKVQMNRLSAAIQTVKESLCGQIARADGDGKGWWIDCACASLQAAEAALLRCDQHCGWGALHDAERFMVYGMKKGELLAKAASLKAETESKLKEWRLVATQALFAPLALKEWSESLDKFTEEKVDAVRQALVEALQISHGNSDNAYHRMNLVRKQLSFLVAVCGIMIVVILVLAWLAAPDEDLSFANLIPVVLAGAFGAVLSAMFQLSRVGEAKIPEALVHGLITSGRPLVGAVSALFIYIVLKSNIITLVEGADLTLLPALALSFIAGFSEKFVLSAVAKVSGDEKKN